MSFVLSLFENRQRIRIMIKQNQGAANAIGHSHVFTGMNALIGLVAIPPWHVEGNRLALVSQRHGAHIAVHRCARLRKVGG